MKPRLAVTFFMLVSCDLFSQQYQLTDNGSKILDSVYSSYITRHKIPGLAVGILLSETVLYSKGFGVKNLNSTEQVTGESIFHVASVSKPFVATAVMQLVAQGKLALDSTLLHYLPFFRIRTHGYQSITIRQMLSHTSGLPDVDDYEWDKPQYDEGAPKRYIESLETERLAFLPGEDFGYSNLAYDILGEVITKVSGRPFEEYMRDNVLLCAEMTNSTFLRMSLNDSNATSPHIKGRNGVEVSTVYPYNRCHAPSSTLHSSINEMLKWAATLHRSLGQIDTVVSSRSLQQMITPYFEIDPFTSMGLGWFIHTDNEIQYVFHTGQDVGFTSMFVLFPAHRLSMVVLSNCDFMNVMHATSTAFRVLQQNKPLPSFDNLFFVR